MMDDYMMTFEQFREYVTYTPLQPDWREGQQAFNLLFDENPYLADVIRGTPYDPFHQDDRLPEFWRFLELRWSHGEDQGQD